MSKGSEKKQNTVSFLVNGKRVTAAGGPGRRLIDVLRDDLGLTGTKEGCSEGTCGACTVILDGKPVKSCLKPLAAMEGREVTTIEGLGSADAPHPLQRAFVEAGAIQCGFCTPGMLLRAASLLERNPDPSYAEVIRALAPNLCRCTGYKKIVEAVLAAAAITAAPESSVNLSTRPPASEKPVVAWYAQSLHYTKPWFEEKKKGAPSENGWVGSRVRPLGVWEKALGSTKFAADLTPENCVHLKVVRSDKHHALITGIETEEALSCPGVLAVFTARDIGGTNRIGPILRDQPVLADDRIRYFGEAVAVVAAESKAAAEKGASKVTVTHEDLPAIHNPLEALKPESPKLHKDSNVLFAMQIKKGDVEEGFGSADAIVESSYETPFNDHGYLEPEAGVAWPDGEGRVAIRLATQNPHENQAQVAQALGIKQEQLRVIQAPTGGSFGGKMNHHVAALLGLAVLKLSRPAKLVYQAAESLISTEKRHPFKLRFKTGATKDGKLVALQAELLANTGAYASYGKAVLERAHIHATGPYEIPHVFVQGNCVYTNAAPAGAMRGFGAPQVAFAVESQMDLLAKKLDLDPFEFRRRNVLRKGSATATGQKLEASVGAEETLKAIEPYYRKAMSWANASQSHPDSSHFKRGVGISSIFFGIGEAGWKNPSKVGIRLTPDGWVELLVGAADMGQGVFSTLAQIAAETLGVPMDCIRVLTPDTDLTPNAGPTEASRQTMVSGLATQQAAASLKNAWETISPPVPGTEPLKKRLAFLYDACRKEGIPVEYFGYYKPAIQPIDESGRGRPHLVYAFASHLARVEVDVDNGSFRVVQLVAAHDIGKAVNPLTLEGQIEGGLMMALGFALKEEFQPGVTRKWSHYQLPRTTDLPEIINLLVEEPNPEGPFGAKGVGEVPAVGPAAAIVNAVANACGVRASRLPLTPAQFSTDRKASESL